MNPNCAVCNHPFSLHKNGGECTVRVDDSWRSRWCDCHGYCAPRLVDSGVDPSDPDYLDYQEQAEWRAQQ